MRDTSTQRARREYLKVVGAAGAAGLTGLSGCTFLNQEGSGGGGGGGSDTLTIAATVPKTGQFSALGKPVEQGYRLGISRMKEQLDRDVELVLQDDESDPEQVRKSLQQMVSNNDVDMIWGSFSSLLVTAGSAFAESQGLPFLGAFFAYEAPHRREGYEWTYAPFPKSRDVARSTKGLLELVPEGQRPSRVGIWEPNSGWGKEQSNYWADVLGSAGYEVVLRQKYSLGSSDFSSLITQSKSQNVEILLSVPTPPGGIKAFKQMKQNNFAPKVVKFVRAADPPAWWSALGQTGAYACMCPGWVPGMTGNGNKRMRQAYESEYGLDQGQLVPVPVGGAYNIAQVALQSVQAAGSTEAGALQEALRNTEFGTVIGDFTFQKNGLPTEGELTAPTGQWWEGGQHVVYPDTQGEAAIDFKYPLKPWGQR